MLVSFGLKYNPSKCIVCEKEAKPMNIGGNISMYLNVDIYNYCSHHCCNFGNLDFLKTEAGQKFLNSLCIKYGFTKKGNL